MKLVIDWYQIELSTYSVRIHYVISTYSVRIQYVFITKGEGCLDGRNMRQGGKLIQIPGFYVISERI